MEFELIFKNDTKSDIQSSSLSAQTFLSAFLVAVFIALSGALVRGKRLNKLFDVAYLSSSRNSTGIPSVSILMLLKCIYLYGADLQKIVETAIEKHGGILRLNLPGFCNNVFVTNPSMVQKIYMSSNLGHLNKPKVYDNICLGPMKGGLVTSSPETWKLHRNVISKAFTYNGLLRQLNIFEEHAKQLVLSLQETCVPTPCLEKPMISVEKHVHAHTFEIILHIAAGKQVHDVSQEESIRFHNNFEKIKELAAYRIFHFINMLDFVWNRNPIKKEMDRTIEELGSYANMITAAIRKQFEVDAKIHFQTDDDMAGKSLVELMINAGFSNEEIFSELSSFLVAGHETVSTTVKLLLFILGTHKEYQDKCRKEIDQMFDKMYATNCNEISMEILNSLTFLEMCIKECLRMYPGVPVFGRKLESSIQLDENTYLPEGTNVFISPWIIHRNSNIYPDPEKFDPERFSSENIRNRGMGEYIPFSLGPRNCIGFRSAMIELKVLMAYVLHNFEVHSDMTIANLNCLLSKALWPFPELDIKISPRE